MREMALLSVVALLTTACTREPTPVANQIAAPDPVAVPTFAPASDYVGHWTGVEGMFLDIEATDRPGRYRLTMQYDLDNRQTALARLDGDTLVFERKGARETLRPTDGTATGLKYLAAKKKCLTVGAGEGYCRD